MRSRGYKLVRYFAHAWPVRAELGAVDVEEDSGVADVYAHRGIPSFEVQRTGWITVFWGKFMIFIGRLIHP
jgi:hypothetical protein